MRDFNADTHKATRGAFAEFFEALFVKVLRVRIETGDHARDGFSDELLLVDRFDVIALDHAENCGQLLQLFQRQRPKRTSGGGLQ